MTCFKFVSFLSRPYLSINMFHVRFTFKRHAHHTSFKRLPFGSYNHSDKINIFQVNRKCIPSFYINSHKVENGSINSGYFRKSIRECENGRNFHTSAPRHIHPILWAVFRPALKLMAVLTGR